MFESWVIGDDDLVDLVDGDVQGRQGGVVRVDFVGSRANRIVIDLRRGQQRHREADKNEHENEGDKERFTRAVGERGALPP